MAKATREDFKAVERLIGVLPPETRAKLTTLPSVASRLDRKWLPNPGPQAAACASPADELFFGGEAAAANRTS